MTREEEIAVLKAKIAARENKSGFKQNIDALKARLAELESENG